MKSVYLLAVAIGAGLALGSCSKVLDKENLSAINGSLIYSDSTLVNLNLNYIYDQNLPTWGGQTGSGIGSVNPATLADESYGDNIYVDGQVQVNDVGDFGTALAPNNNYGKLRTINQFLLDVKNGSLPQGTKNRLRAQAQFFRAFRYFDLVRVYGGVPLSFTPLNAVGPDARANDFLPRNSTADTYKAIVGDLDSAIAVLPGKWTSSSDWGRITRGAAAAFKARVLLTAASPQFNPTDDMSKWQAAYAASQQAVSLLTASGFGLNSSFDQLWFQEVNNPESVLVTGYNTSTGTNVSKSNGYDNSARPSYTGTGGGSYQPCWEMVKAFPMLDGKKPGASTKYTYTDQLFYKNRDPRFDKTIAYNGCTWPLNGNSSFKLWTYYVGTKPTETTASKTGFYTRKAVDPNVAVANAQYSGTDWIEIRYAEVLLNLAETACGTNNLSVAMDQLKAIRKRAGIEAGTDGNYGLQAGLSRAQLFDAILYERQIELAFEGKRFWDLRRWKRVESALNALPNKRRHKLLITLKSTGVPADFATTRDNLNLDQVYTNYFTLDFTSSATYLDTKDLNWLPQYYFFPIPQLAIDNNPKLVQNNTWGGAFDPLQ
ncbi:RagB/SusD family nutrient uptake outer membrane protein [Hymenobacter ginsengisoli]|uniref:RagB/SusD family nutrient uptake outer membrane protein n=1 Tax=Hymenobacter ginsengisoli TaxID=1051626 RepID=A0ABP8Q5S5_9BACT|nr:MULTISPECIES: RagB/SusD family nutrient uptake outer membrane protein [unclassified Hymenobacter]MBO2032383.1 RagB/SusD family nutrient uptake outer membrane protein [Hymenobacter sp. BT559]